MQDSVTPSSRFVPPLGQLRVGTPPQLSVPSSRPCMELSPMSRRTISPPSDPFNAAEYFERAIRPYERRAASWTPDYSQWTQPCDKRLLRDVMQPQGISRLATIPDIVHLALNELVWEMAGFSASAYNRCLLNAAGWTSLMEVPLSHRGWALQPKVQSDRGDSDDATSDEKDIPALGNARGRKIPRSLKKKQRNRLRRKAEAAARRRPRCEITPSMLLARMYRLVEQDSLKLRP